MGGCGEKVYGEHRVGRIHFRGLEAWRCVLFYHSHVLPARLPVSGGLVGRRAVAKQNTTDPYSAIVDPVQVPWALP